MDTEHTKPIYNDDDAARAHLEAILWPHGSVCPLCGLIGEATLLKGKSHRKGVYNCKPCDKPFTVTIGTVFESSHIPLHKWVYGMHLMAASKKGVSALQLQRQLGLGSYRSAWFMAHRLREALRLTDNSPIDGEGKIVEADETYYGKVKLEDMLTAKGAPYQKRGKGKGRGPANKRAVVALVERGGDLRSSYERRRVIKPNASTLRMRSLGRLVTLGWTLCSWRLFVGARGRLEHLAQGVVSALIGQWFVCGLRREASQIGVVSRHDDPQLVWN